MRRIARAPGSGSGVAGYRGRTYRCRAHGIAIARSGIAPEPPAIGSVRGRARGERPRFVDLAVAGRPSGQFRRSGRQRAGLLLYEHSGRWHRARDSQPRLGMGLRAGHERRAGVQRGRGPGGTERASTAFPKPAVCSGLVAWQSCFWRYWAHCCAEFCARCTDSNRRLPSVDSGQQCAARGRLSARTRRRRAFAQCLARLGAAPDPPISRHARKPCPQPEDATCRNPHGAGERCGEAFRREPGN